MDTITDFSLKSFLELGILRIRLLMLLRILRTQYVDHLTSPFSDRYLEVVAGNPQGVTPTTVAPLPSWQDFFFSIVTSERAGVVARAVVSIVHRIYSVPEERRDAQQYYGSLGPNVGRLGEKVLRSH